MELRAVIDRRDGRRRRKRRAHREVATTILQMTRTRVPTDARLPGPTTALAPTSAPSRDAGDRVEAVRWIADGPCTDDGEMALGKNLVAIMPWEATTTRTDHPVQPPSKRTLTSIHTEGEGDRCPRHRWARRRSPAIPNIDEVLATLMSGGIVRIGARGSRRGDRRQGHPEGETELRRRRSGCCAIFGEKRLRCAPLR